MEILPWALNHLRLDVLLINRKKNLIEETLTCSSYLDSLSTIKNALEN